MENCRREGEAQQARGGKGERTGGRGEGREEGGGKGGQHRVEMEGRGEDKGRTNTIVGEGETQDERGNAEHGDEKKGGRKWRAEVEGRGERTVQGVGDEERAKRENRGKYKVGEARQGGAGEKKNRPAAATPIVAAVISKPDNDDNLPTAGLFANASSLPCRALAMSLQTESTNASALGKHSYRSNQLLQRAGQPTMSVPNKTSPSLFGITGMCSLTPRPPSAPARTAKSTAIRPVYGSPRAATTVQNCDNIACWGGRILVQRRRQLEIATQYLNNSVLSPTPPMHSFAVRPATFNAETRPNRWGFAAGYDFSDSRPKTNGSVTSRELHLRDRTPSISDGTDLDQNIVCVLSPRPLTDMLPSRGSPSRINLIRVRQRQSDFLAFQPHGNQSLPAAVEVPRNAIPFKIYSADKKSTKCTKRHPVKHPEPARGLEGVDRMGEVGYDALLPFSGTAGGIRQNSADRYSENQRSAVSSMSPKPVMPTHEPPVVLAIPKLPLDQLLHGVQVSPVECSESKQTSICPRKPTLDSYEREQSPGVRDHWHSQSSTSRSAPLPYENASRNEGLISQDQAYRAVREEVNGKTWRYSFSVSRGWVPRGLRRSSSEREIYHNLENAALEEVGLSFRTQSLCTGFRRVESASTYHSRVGYEREVGESMRKYRRSGQRLSTRSTGDDSEEWADIGERALERGVVLKREGGNELLAQHGVINNSFLLSSEGDMSAHHQVLCIGGNILAPSPPPIRLSPAYPRVTMPSDFKKWEKIVPGRGEKWMMPTKNEVIRWGREIDLLLRRRARCAETDTMMIVNGNERFVDGG